MGSTKESGSNQESGGGTPQRLGCVQICSLVLHQQDITHSQSSCVRRGGCVSYCLPAVKAGRVRLGA